MTSTTPDTSLTEQQLAMLDFERAWWKYAAVKHTAIRDRFDLSPGRYYMALNTLIDHPDALKADPMLVRRLRRLRANRAAQRAARRLDFDSDFDMA